MRSNPKRDCPHGHLLCSKPIICLGHNMHTHSAALPTHSNSQAIPGPSSQYRPQEYRAQSLLPHCHQMRASVGEFAFQQIYLRSPHTTLPITKSRAATLGTSRALPMPSCSHGKCPTIPLALACFPREAFRVGVKRLGDHLCNARNCEP